jgi:hypothetical protein
MAKRELNVPEAELILEVIEQLVAELGLDLVPAEVDVDSATGILNEVINGGEEEVTEVEMEKNPFAAMDADLEEKCLTGVE